MTAILLVGYHAAVSATEASARQTSGCHAVRGVAPSIWWGRATAASAGAIVEGVGRLLRVLAIAPGILAAVVWIVFHRGRWVRCVGRARRRVLSPGALCGDDSLVATSRPGHARVICSVVGGGC